MPKLIRLAAAIVPLALAACTQNPAAVEPTSVATHKPAATASAGVQPIVPATTVIATPSPTPVTPSILAVDLSAVELAIQLPGTSATEYANLGPQEQNDLLLLESHPDWVPSVLNAVPPSVRPRIQANLQAAQQIDTLNGVSTHLPHWKIITPAPPDTLLSYYQEAQQTYGVPWQYLAAINLIETNMGRIQGLSSAGAEGPMQFMPSTWAYYGRGDVNNPHDAILAAGRYLKAHGAPSDMPDAIYAYNPSMLYVRAVELYAQQMFSQQQRFLAYYNWQVYVPMPGGPRLLPEGFSN